MTRKSPQELMIWVKNTLRESFVSFWVSLTSTIKIGVSGRFWLVCIFVLGVGLGLGTKTFALAHFTIGYGDYRLPSKKQVFDLNRSREQALAEGSELTAPKEKTVYPYCSLESE